MKRIALLLLVSGVALWSGGTSKTPEPEAAGDDWSAYNGTPGGTHYSRLKDINTNNVHRLKVAWEYDTGDQLQVSKASNQLNSTMESNPLIVQGHLFFVSPRGRLICLDGATGRELWSFEPQYSKRARSTQRVRGVSYWTDGRDRRILFAFRRNLYAIDADTGKPANGFGSSGQVALTTVSTLSTTPGAVYKDLVIVGGSGSLIQAFDVRTGQTRWIFHTVPMPGQTGYDTWPAAAWTKSRGANDWAGMALDETRGLVYAPLGEPFDTAYGADRAGENLFSDSLVALDANTGRLVWHFQTVRHDLWDRDLPAPPTLVTVTREGKRLDALALVTKSGFVYVLDRTTGKSLWPLIEKKSFASEIPGEVVASTQLEPRWPLPFARHGLTANLLTHRTPEANAAVLSQFRTLSARGPWDPPSEQGTVVFPGCDGGAEWGGAAYDPETDLLYVNSNEMAWILRLHKHVLSAARSGSALYRENCAGCHGENRAGRPPDFPSLIGIAERLSAEDIKAKIAAGGDRMPTFLSLGAERIAALVAYLRSGADEPIADEFQAAEPSPTQEVVYGLEDLPRFLDPEGYPAISPPWGTLNAINLNTGGYAWKIPFGEFPELAAKGLKNTGSENYGGPIVTAGGLLFIGATSFDNKFHAYDKHTGKLLWETVLPAAGIATPATYRASGQQFVVIAAGGGKPQQSKPGSKLVAFAIPD
jgi:quinoprotein glucose dehydrogenase